MAPTRFLLFADAVATHSRRDKWATILNARNAFATADPADSGSKFTASWTMRDPLSERTYAATAIAHTYTLNASQTGYCVE